MLTSITVIYSPPLDQNRTQAGPAEVIRPRKDMLFTPSRVEALSAENQGAGAGSTYTGSEH